MHWNRLVAIATFAGAGSLSAQRTDHWLTTLGRDTVAFEKTISSRRQVEGMLTTIAPRVRRISYRVDFNDDGTVRQYTFSSVPGLEGPGAAPPQSVVADFGTAGITAVVRRADKVDTVRVGGAGQALPNALYAWGLFGLATKAARAKKGDSVVVEQWGAGARAVSKTAVVRRGDSVAVDVFGSPMMAKVDKQGNLLGVDGNRTTLKVIGKRVKAFDYEALTNAFVARERSGQVAGALSTRDTVQATVLGAALWIDYGRPSKRGRQILGGVIPYDQVWRTGANAATQFRTSKALVMGDLTIPAGTYTLWTVPTTRGVTLIINRQTGQWGTAYDASQDLGKVMLDIEKLDEPVERFTISTMEESGQGQLRFDWDHTRWVARFKTQ